MMDDAGAGMARLVRYIQDRSASVVARGAVNQLSRQAGPATTSASTRLIAAMDTVFALSSISV
jgi:hypothetical protein